MPKFNIGVNTADTDPAEGMTFEPWSGPLPPKGSYTARLKVAKLVPITSAANKGAFRVFIVCELITNDEYNGAPVFGNVNLIESGKSFVNQWLKALTDGSDAQYDKILKAFNGGQVHVDEKKEHIKAIGNVKVNSPNGELPVKISLGHNTYNGKTTAKVMSFLWDNNGGGLRRASTSNGDEPAEEIAVALDDEEELFAAE